MIMDAACGRMLRLVFHGINCLSAILSHCFSLNNNRRQAANKITILWPSDFHLL